MLNGKMGLFDLGLCIFSGSYKLMPAVWCWVPTGHK